MASGDILSATKCGSGFPAAMIEAESLSHIFIEYPYRVSLRAKRLSSIEYPDEHLALKAGRFETN